MLSKGWRRLEAEMPLTAATTSERHAAEPIEVIPSGRALGVEVRGIDLTKLGDAAFARLILVPHLNEPSKRSVAELREIDAPHFDAKRSTLRSALIPHRCTPVLMSRRATHPS